MYAHLKLLLQQHMPIQAIGMQNTCAFSRDLYLCMCKEHRPPTCSKASTYTKMLHCS